MNVVSDIIYNVAILFIMMIPGIILKKSGMVSDSFGKGLSNLVLYIAQPSLIVLAYIRDFDKEILINSIYVLILSMAAHAIFAAIAIPTFKKAPDGEARMLKFSTIFANAAFMGIPLIKAVLEKEYPGATLYASIYNISFNLFLWSLGVNICTKDRDVNKDGVDDYEEVSQLRKPPLDDDVVVNASGSILKAIIHPVTIAALIGLAFFILPINSYVPDIVMDSLTKLSNLVAPLSMVVIGLRLPDISFKGVHKDKYMYIFLALRHFALPLIMIAIIKLLGLAGLVLSPVITLVIIILAATPAATSATMFAEKFNCDSAYVSKLVAISTILSIATIPLVLLLV